MQLLFWLKKIERNTVELLFLHISRVYVSLEVNHLYVFLIFRFQDRKQVRGSVWIIAVMMRTLK